VFTADSATHPILRRWDLATAVEQEGKETADGTLVIEEDVPVRLEGGSEVQFPRVRTASATNTAPRTAG
jgi:hypothetical protein